MEKLDFTEIASKYNALTEIWSENDRWHGITWKMINDFIHASLQLIPNSQESFILNAGSAGYSYGMAEESIIHIDIADKRIAHLSNAVVGNIESLPFNEEEFDLIICVGSVINYCDPVLVISEFSRVLKKKGYLIVEFEDSKTPELWGTKSYGKKVMLRDTFYNEQREKLWYFSSEFIVEMLQLNELIVLKNRRCHYLSPLIYRFIKNERISAGFGLLDPIIKHLPLLNQISSNVIFLCQKA